jgi:hypothetical protein
MTLSIPFQGPASSPSCLWPNQRLLVVTYCDRLCCFFCGITQSCWSRTSGLKCLQHTLKFWLIHEPRGSSSAKNQQVVCTGLAITALQQVITICFGATQPVAKPQLQHTCIRLRCTPSCQALLRKREEQEVAGAHRHRAAAPYSFPERGLT